VLLLKNTQKIDTNIFLRYVLDDHAELSPKAKKIIDEHIVEVPIEVLCEVVYVLTGYYKIDRQSVGTKLKHFFEQTKCILSNREAVMQGLEYFGTTSLDFVDCVLAGYAKIDDCIIHTFDDKLQKLLGTTT